MQRFSKYRSEDGQEHDSRAAAERRDAELELRGWLGERFIADPGQFDEVVTAAPALLALLKRIVPPAPRQKRSAAAEPPAADADPSHSLTDEQPPKRGKKGAQ